MKIFDLARVTSGLCGLLGVRLILGSGLQGSDSSQCEDGVVLNNMLGGPDFVVTNTVIGRSVLLNG
jgi:hypothetical protein